MVSAGYWTSVYTAMLFAYWAYIGYAAASFVAGEVKEAHRSMPRAIFTSGILVMVLYMLISTLLAHAGGMIGQSGGFSFIDAVAFMKNNAAGSFGDLPAVGAWMPVFAGIQAFGISATFGHAVGWMLLIFGVFWVANDIPPFILTCSRMIFAMAFDRVLPEKLADVNEKWHSPVNAVFATSVAALLGAVSESDLFANVPFLGKILSSSGGVTATDLWDIMFFTGVAVACAMFPARLPGVYERSAYKQKKVVVQVLGWIATVGNIWLAYLVLRYGWGIWFDNLGAFIEAPFLFTIFLILVGVSLYYWGRSRAKRTGTDLNTIFAEIPPE
jgi:APA family basic amino acid/polyamine antiporter